MSTNVAERFAASVVAVERRPAATNGPPDTGRSDPSPTNGNHGNESAAAAPVFSPPREEDWQRRGREVAAARRAEVAARLAERQRAARNEARLVSWGRERV